MWCHDRTPELPPWRVPASIVQSAKEAVDYRIEGPDAAAAARTWAGPRHPLYLYDRPPPKKLQPLQEKFDAVLSENGLRASLVPLKDRVTHRRRIDLLLGFSPAGGEIFFGGAWGTVVTGLPTDRPLAVVGERMPPGEYADRWRSVALVCRPRAKVARSEQAATVSVDEARLGFFDVDAVGAWRHEEPIDGRADFLFWGRDAEAVAAETGAPQIGEGSYGWEDLPVREAAERGTRVEELREQRGLKFATDFRPHSDHYRVMKQVRASATESGTIEVGGARTCTFMTTWGDGCYPVFRDLDAKGRLARVRIDLGNEEVVAHQRSLEGE
jgi:hypothetical protein